VLGVEHLTRLVNDFAREWSDSATKAEVLLRLVEELVDAARADEREAALGAVREVREWWARYGRHGAAPQALAEVEAKILERGGRG